jgi:putative FmdB family regulatory protein
MPIYEYECTHCRKVTEAVQRFSDSPLTECSHCHGHLRKLISRSTFHLKGSGWYVTDYSGKNQSTSACPSTSGGEQSSTATAKTETTNSTSTTTTASTAE